MFKLRSNEDSYPEAAEEDWTVIQDILSNKPPAVLSPRVSRTKRIDGVHERMTRGPQRLWWPEL